MVRGFTVSALQACATSEEIESRVHQYLTTGPWANKPLSDGLKLKERFWLGPIQVPLDNLDRVCGPEEHMPYWQPAASWEEQVTKMIHSLDDVEQLPPLIASTDDGRHQNPDGSSRFILADGNHRHEALRRLGYSDAYVLIWFESEADRQSYIEERKKAEL